MLPLPDAVNGAARMPAKDYCYCCRVHHDQAKMHLFRTGLRWRYARSIAITHDDGRERLLA